MSHTMHVRLKPYEPKRGHVLRTYCIYGVRFLEKRGWYEVPTTLADKLQTIPQRHGDPNSPRAFDVKTSAEAEVADIKAKEAPLRREARDANPVRVHETRLPDGVVEDGDMVDAPLKAPSSGSNKKKKASTRLSK